MIEQSKYDEMERRCTALEDVLTTIVDRHFAGKLELRYSPEEWQRPSQRSIELVVYPAEYRAVLTTGPIV